MNPQPEAMKTLAALALAGVALAGVALATGGEPQQLSLGPLGSWQVKNPHLGRSLALAVPAPTPVLDSSLTQLLAEADTTPAYRHGQDSLRPGSRPLPDYSQLAEEYRIENPPSASGTRPLDAFFRALQALEAGQGPARVRIAHYGDSQIEGDRISYFLRRSMQRQFGGGGLGYLQLEEPATHHSVDRTWSGPWTKYTVFQKELPDGLYGPAGVAFRYTPPLASTELPLADSMGADTLVGPPAPPPSPADTLGGSALATLTLTFKPTAGVTRLSLLYGAAPPGSRVTLPQNNYTTALAPEAAWAVAELPLPQPDGPPTEVTLAFSGGSPNIYGLWADGPPVCRWTTTAFAATRARASLRCPRSTFHA